MTEPAYQIVFDFDAEGDPPTVLILDNTTANTVVEVFEEPTCREGDWSWIPEDWEPGPLARGLCALMNCYPHSLR